MGFTRSLDGNAPIASLTIPAGRMDISELSMQENIANIASFVSVVWTRFLYLDNAARKQLQSQRICIETMDCWPSEDECSRFQSMLKEVIIFVLSRNEDRSIEILTEYGPEGILYKIAHSVFQENIQINYLFPYKSHIKIALNQNDLFLSMNFKLPTL